MCGVSFHIGWPYLLANIFAACLFILGRHPWHLMMQLKLCREFVVMSQSARPSSRHGHHDHDIAAAITT